ncbi:MAG: hypothetical protein OXG06_00475 [Gammaproteobacteria bacterium]|nr:hypothetical protein [Gammaproteobacteria bacterium]
MKYLIKLTVFAMFTLVLAASQVYAGTCPQSERVGYTDSWCLKADLDSNNGNFFKQSRWELENLCANTTIKAKIDLQSSPDSTYTLNGGDTASGSSGARLRTASCCKDGATKVNNINACTFSTEAAFNAAVAAEAEDENS